jgi:PKD repeat protein
MVTKTNHVIVHPPSECAFFACPTGGAPPLRVGFVNQLMDYATGYLWNFGDGSTSTEAQPVHFYTQPGTFDVSLTVQTDLGSATITFDDYINVQPHFVTPAPLLVLNGPEFAIKSTGDADVCGWNLWSNGFVAHDVKIDGERRWFVIDVVATGSFAAGEWPKLQMLIDDEMIGEQIIASAKPQTYRFLAQLSAGAHTVKLALPNHAVDPVSGQARHLWITRFLMFDSGEPLPVPGRLNAATMTIKSHGDSLGNGAWNLFANGFLGHGLAVADSGDYTLQVKASAHVANGEGAKLTVTIDGVASDTVEVAAGSSWQFNFPLTLRKGNHLLQLEFINNFFDPATREDRDLILHEFSVSRTSPPQAPKVVINEIVTDPQQDWNDSAGGNGVEFDAIPGNGAITDTDEWVELFNAGTEPVNLSGWTIELINGTNVTLNFSSTGGMVLRFSAGGSAANFQAGEYLVIGNPPGAINNDVFIVLKDETGAVVDKVEIGDDFENDGNGDGAPDGGTSDGNASGINDEAVARQPNAVDTDNDVADFAKQAATIGMSNGTNLISDVHGTMTAAPGDFVLSGTYPNPFNPATQIKFGVPELARVALTIHNLTGQEVARPFEGDLAAGEYEREWNAEGYVSGIYFVRLAAISKSSGRQVNLVKKMVLAK